MSYFSSYFSFILTTKDINKILLSLMLVLAIINPFTFEGFILELIILGIFYKQYKLYCKECKLKSTKYGLSNLV